VANDEPPSSKPIREKSLTEQLDAAKKKVAVEPEYLLRYKFQPDELIRWKVTHLGTTETTIQGNTQSSKSRSVSTKQWRVTQVDELGNITFTHSVSDVEMWQKLSDRPEVSYNSRTDKEVPPEYEFVASTLGKTLATVVVAPDGQIVKRDGSPALNLGLGDIIMLLPPKPVKVGGRWHEPSEIQGRLSDGTVKRIKVRKSYTLEKVQTGVASINVRTEVLTPIDDPKLESQIVQQLTNGTLRFDLDAGRLLSKQMDWDETVVGFNGADSQLKYLARITEEIEATVPTSVAN
jgi:hypothetical protein